MKRKLFSTRVLTLLGAVSLGACAGDQSAPTPATSSEAIISGTLDAASPPLFPSLGALTAPGSTSLTDVFCGGTLVAPQWVVTAAHCFNDNWNADVDIVFAANPSLGKLRARHRSAISGPIRTVAPGPYYSDGTISEWYSAHDVALVKLDAPVPSRWGIPIAPIAGVAGTPQAGLGGSYTAVGYGPTSRTNPNDTSPSGTNFGLRSFSNPPSDDIDWSGGTDDYRIEYSRDAGDVYYGGSPGDSGGPLLNADGKILGIASTLYHTDSAFWGSYWAPVMRNQNEVFLKTYLETPSGGLVGAWNENPCVGYPYEADSDDDGIPNHCDNCLTVKNTTQWDSDGDGVGSSCDNCATVPNPLQQDSNIEAEYELTCRAGACAPNFGEAPAAAGTAAEVHAFQANFAGDACDYNRVSRLSLSDARTPVQTTGTCTNYIDKFLFKLPYQGSCYFQATNDLLVSDGIGDPAGNATPTLGNVAHYACDCSPSAYTSVGTEIERLRACQNNLSYRCRIARDGDTRELSSPWSTLGYNRVTEVAEKPSEGSSSSGPLVFFAAEATGDSRYGNRRGQRTARWDLSADRARIGAGATGTYEGMLWSKASPETPAPGALAQYIPAADTANDYALTSTPRTIAGNTTFGAALYPKARIPWFEWVMNPSKHRGDIGEILVPVRQQTEGVRVFAFGADGTRDVSGRFTSAARERFAQVEDGTLRLALAPARTRTVAADGANRAVTLNALTGAVTGVFRVAAGVTTWTAIADAFSPGAPPEVASFDPTTGTLLFVVDHKLVVRAWSSDGFQAATAIADLPENIAFLQPSADGLRFGALAPTKFEVFEGSPEAYTQANSWPIAPNTETWISSGLRGETFLAFRRADGKGGVLVYEKGGVTGYLINRLSGPAAVDASGGIVVMTDVRDDVTPPATTTLANTSRVSESSIAARLEGI